MDTVYRLESDTLRFRALVPPESERFVELAAEFDGTRISGAWIPFNCHYDPGSMDLRIGDFPSIGLPHILVFSAHAANVLTSLLAENGDLLPLTCDGTEYFAFNAMRLVNALNYEHSDIVYYSSGRIMDVRKYALDIDRLVSAPIFKLRETLLMDVFVTAEFVNSVEAANLQGFMFEPVLLVS